MKRALAEFAVFFAVAASGFAAPTALVDRAGAVECAACTPANGWVASGVVRRPLVPPGTASFDRIPTDWLDGLAAELDRTAARWLLLDASAQDPPEVAAFLLKQASALTRSRRDDARVALLLGESFGAESMAALARLGAAPYVDLIGPPAGAAADPAFDADLLAQGWPVARLLRPRGEASALAAFLAAAANDASVVLVECPSDVGATDRGAWWADAGALVAWTRSFEDAHLGRAPAPGRIRWTLIDGSRSGTVDSPAFVEEQTLAEWILLPAFAGPALFERVGDDRNHAELIDPASARRTRLDRRVIAESAPGDWPRGAFAVAAGGLRWLRLQRPTRDQPDIREAAQAEAARPGLSAQEIIARHRVRRARIDAERTNYVATNRTRLRFWLGDLAESFELEIRGPYFWQRPADIEWVWQEMWLNGVRWRGEKVPELPLMQPEKVAIPPLAISFTEDYAYERLDDSALDDGDWAGRPLYVLGFEPADATKSLYRGRAFVDPESFDVVRTEAIQVRPGEDIVSNEEVTRFGRASDGYPVPIEMRGQTAMKTAGQVTVIERQTRFEGFRIDSPTFLDERLAARASKAVMVKETDQGIRYFEPVDDAPAGERRVVEDLSRQRLFGLLGVFYDDALDYPVPLGGVNYLNFDLFGKGIQTNVFFAGALLLGSLSDPSLFGSRWDLTADGFAFAFRNSEEIWVDGAADDAQTVESRPAWLNVSIGRPLGSFWKATLGYRYRYVSYARADDTAENFVVPASGGSHGVSLGLRWDRLGYSLSGEYERWQRETWTEWGIPGANEWKPEHEDYAKWTLHAGKEWSFPRFQRLRLGVTYLGGDDLDRFSKYSFGFFGGTRVGGFSLGSVRIERALIANATYGVSIAELFRLELGIDHARATDEAAGWDDTGFTGATLSGNTMGPWETIVQYSVGVPIDGPNADGFVLYLVVLKVF